jgi:hypothetical protein
LYLNSCSYFLAHGICVSLIIINIEMADVILCEHQKKTFFYQDVTAGEDLLCGRSTMSQLGYY